MDPDETLRRLRRAVVEQPGDECGEIGELVDALDGWLSRGGALPQAWRTFQRADGDR